MSAGVQAVERRRFSRIPFEAAVRLTHPSGNWSGKLVDISLKGILITRPQNWFQPGDESFLIEIHPPGDAFSIRMEMRMAHERGQMIGFECKHIDLDSVSHLRRLVELNLGSDAILQREFGELGELGEQKDD